jgi:hypothetical protein
MWYSKKNKETESFNDQISLLKGDFEDKQAKITLAKFLRTKVSS